MPVPDFQTLMLPVLKAVADGESTAASLRERVAAAADLSDTDQQELLPSGRQTTFANRVAWANVFLQRAGLIRPVRRGAYEITDVGRAVLAETPTRIDIGYLRRFPAFVEWRARSADQTDAGAAQVPAIFEPAPFSVTPDEQIERAHRTLQAELEASLLTRLKESSPAFFEGVIVDLLVAMGYGGGRREMGAAIGKSGDGGIDGVIREDELGLDAVYLQAKRYNEQSVGERELRDFVGSLEGQRATKGVFVTTSVFTRSARDFVDRIARRIVLIDGQQLATLMVRHNVGVRTRSTYEIKAIDEDYFVD